jgi:Dehydrogenases with different specificities (related to short-chain alcohol dehydrogenases)
MPRACNNRLLRAQRRNDYQKMPDRYLEFAQSAFGRRLATKVGLPVPPRLRRDASPWSQTGLEGRRLLLGGAEGSALGAELVAAVAGTAAELSVAVESPGLPAIKRAARSCKITLHNPPAADGRDLDGLLFDATGLREPSELIQLHAFFHPRLRRLPPGARIVVLGAAVDPELDPTAQVCAMALDGFVRSLAKEVGRSGATANLLRVGAGAAAWLAGPLRFLLSDHGSYVDGQTRTPSAECVGEATNRVCRRARRPTRPGHRRGARYRAGDCRRAGARGCGSHRHRSPRGRSRAGCRNGRIRWARSGARHHRPAAPAVLAREVRRLGGVDILVHNAGITRDKLLRNMRRELWQQVMAVNLEALPRLTLPLLDAGSGQGGLRQGGRVICISSIGGIAGNAGQTNYGASKAGVIGFVRALAPRMADLGGTINVVAPGFIETAMTDAMPALQREAGRRMTSLLQAGVPEDVAEAVAFLAMPAAGAINGQTLRVCGQHMVGA